MIRFALGVLVGVAASYLYALWLSATPESRDGMAVQQSTTSGPGALVWNGTVN